MIKPDPAHIAEWGKGMWDVFDRLAKRSRSEGLSQSDIAVLAHEEAEILDLFRRYHCFYDAADIDGVMSLFTDDCAVINPRGTYVGAQAVRKNYEYLCTRRRFVMHYGTNTLVRFEPGMQEAWLGAFYLAVTINPDGTSYGTGGSYMDRLHKRSGTWKVFEQRITGNFIFDIEKSVPKAPPPPAGASQRNSSELIEKSTIL